MKSLRDFEKLALPIDVLFTDIDDTITTEGQLPADSYQALWDLHEAGVKIVPVTGRPAGWCEMIARFWPVAGIVGENGGLYFRYDMNSKKMLRHFAIDEKTRSQNQAKLEKIRIDVLREVPGCAIASDQFCRIMDLAVDFAEDVGPLSENDVDKIVAVFERHGAQAKVSSIHVNGWFGDYNKLSMCKIFVARELDMNLDRDNKRCAFTGDSPNDEPMFQFFENSFAVANINKFITRVEHKPKFVAELEGAEGFVEIADVILQALEN